VRLPRDWLGPRDELVPFGPRAESEAPDPPATETSSDAPPSADDFWGERSAAIHGALQAPESWADVDSAPSGSTRSDGDVTERGSVRVRAVRRPRVRVRAVRLPRANRRAVAVALAALAAAAVVFVVVVPAFRTGGARPAAGESRAGVAAVFSGGISEILQRGLARFEAGLSHDGATFAARSAASTARRAQHRVPAPKPHHKAPQSSSTGSSRPHSVAVAAASTDSSSAYRPAGAGTYDATSEDHTSTSIDTPPARSAPPQAPSRSVPTRATVSSTGESGALGPIHSPNG
jgi:hypothetical protein